MRKLLLALTGITLFATGARAQTVTSFDDLTLPQADTFYATYIPGQDEGFNDGGNHFPAYYDTTFGPYWLGGFAYSNMTDSVTSGYTNQFSAKTAQGYNGSANYAVYWGGSPYNLRLNDTGTHTAATVAGFYYTNNTYAYNSMRDGDFIGKKFGGATGSDSDYFYVTVYGYYNGARTADSVNFFLADFRDANNQNDYIVKDWRWVDLTSLGNVDSLGFGFTSSDTASGYINTPTYFCMDNFTVNNNLAVGAVKAATVKIYPVPAHDVITIEDGENATQSVTVSDMSGRILLQQQAAGKTIIALTSLPAGQYLLQLHGNGGKTISHPFQKL